MSCRQPFQSGAAKAVQLGFSKKANKLFVGNLSDTHLVLSGKIIGDP